MIPPERIRAERKKHGWTQEYLAAKVGASPLSIKRWENGSVTPSPHFRLSLAEAFGQPLSDLVQEEIPSVPSHMLATTTDPKLSPIFDSSIPLMINHYFVGRAHELALVKERLRQGGNVAITAINGIPGVGKTTLTIALVHDAEIRNHFRDGILWAGLGPDPNIPGILSHWSTLLGLPMTELTTKNIQIWGSTIRRAIGNRRMLLVIDDVWKAEDALAFQVGGSQCSYLLTTRYPAEANFLTPDGPIHLEELSVADGLSLLRNLAPLAVENEPERAAELVQAVGGLPLAITIMGNYLRRQAYAGQERRIQAAFAQLQEPERRLYLQEPRGSVEAHPSLTSRVLSLEQIIAASEGQLSETANKALYALAVFPPKPHSFSEEAALTVADCDVTILDILVDSGLLSFLGNRLTLHQSIHDFALARLRKERHYHEESFQRFLTFIAHFVTQHHTNYQSLDQEHALINAALDIALVNNKFQDLIVLLRLTSDYFFHRGAYSFLEPYLRQALPLCEQESDQLAIGLAWAHTLHKQGRFQEARTLLQQGLSLAHHIGDIPNIIKFSSHLGWLLPKMGDYIDAEPYLLEALKLAQQEQDRQSIGELYKHLGYTYDFLGRYTEAMYCYQQAFDIAQEFQDHASICMLHNGQGANLATRGKEAEAEAHWQQALKIAQDFDILDPQCTLLVNLAELHNQRETPESLAKAITYLQECQALAETLEIHEWQAIALLIQGAVIRKQGDFPTAERSLREALALGQQLTNQNRNRIIAQCHLELGENELAQGRATHAIAQLQLARETTPAGDREMEALILYSMGRCAHMNGELATARCHGEEARSIMQHIGHGWVKRVDSWLKTLATPGSTTATPSDTEEESNVWT